MSITSPGPGKHAEDAVAEVGLGKFGEAAGHETETANATGG